MTSFHSLLDRERGSWTVETIQAYGGRGAVLGLDHRIILLSMLRGKEKDVGDVSCTRVDAATLEKGDVMRLPV